MVKDVNKENRIFFNHSFDKKRLKALISWVFKESGEAEALKVVDLLKETGFRHATKAGISIGLHDLNTPIQKSWLISESQLAMNTTESDFVGAKITATERSQRIIDTWHRASESLSKQVVDYFGIYDRFNPVYIMALSGARGNFSQVRQLIGMRGLMADQQGKIVNFPIRSNLREGLTLTEYFISCSGARKGLVDTALRTADTGYLTRRLVDVSHHVVVKRIRCNTNRGIAFKSLQSYNKILLTLKERLLGRVLAEDIFHKNEDIISYEHFSPSAEPVQKQGFDLQDVQLFDLQNPAKVNQRHTFACKYKSPICKKICKKATDLHLSAKQEIAKPTRFLKAFQKRVAKKDQEISLKLALKIANIRDKVYLRSPLTCGFTHTVCQLCYGWSISQGSLVSLGDAVGVIAAQSIGEPGTQLTMRTFHTGGVFSGDLLQEIKAPHSGKIEFIKAFQGLLIRTAHGRIAFLSKTEGSLLLKCTSTENKRKNDKDTIIPIPAFTMLFVRQGEKVENNQLLAEFSIRTKEGNQPIKTQQTIFAQLSGRVVEDCSGKVYAKSIKESKIFLNNLESRVSTLQEFPYKSYGKNPSAKASNKILLYEKSEPEIVFKSYTSYLDFCKTKVSTAKASEYTPAIKQKFVQLKEELESTLQNKALYDNSSSFCYTFTKSSRLKVPFFLQKGYTPQRISSFSSYNGYIFGKKLNQQNSSSSLKNSAIKDRQDNSGFPFSNQIFEESKPKPCKLSNKYKSWWRTHLPHANLLPNQRFVFAKAKILFSKKKELLNSPSYFSNYTNTKNFSFSEKRKSFSFFPDLLRKLLRSRSKRRRALYTNFERTGKNSYKFLLNFAFSRRKARSQKERLHNMFVNSRFPKFCKFSWYRFDHTRSCKIPFKNTLSLFRQNKILLKSDLIGLRRDDQKKKWNRQPLRLRQNKQFLSKITDWNVVYGAQNEMLQKIFDVSLKKSSIASKRFLFLNQDKKTQPYVKRSLATVQQIEAKCSLPKQSFARKAEILFSAKSEDLENDTFKYIEPVQSGRLGFLKILSTRIGGTLDYISPVKPFDSLFNFSKNSVKPYKTSCKSYASTNLGGYATKKIKDLFRQRRQALQPFLKKRERFSTFKDVLTEKLQILQIGDLHDLQENKLLKNNVKIDNDCKTNFMRVLSFIRQLEHKSYLNLTPKQGLVRQISQSKVEPKERLNCSVKDLGLTFTCKSSYKSLSLQIEDLYGAGGYATKICTCKQNSAKFFHKSVKKENVFFSNFTEKYFHPELIKENRFFLQTIAEYGDIVEEGYSYNDFNLDETQ